MTSEVTLIVVVVGLVTLIVVLNDWWKRRLPPRRSGPHRLRELNQPQGFFQKLGTTVLLIVFAAFVTPLLLFGLHAMQDPTMRVVLEYVLEVIGVFYLVLLVYVWWKPRWLTSLYNRAESKLAMTAYVLAGAAIVGLAIMGVITIARAIMR